MMLVPGWRWMLRITEGVRSTQAACFTFSALSTMVATSLKRTGRAVAVSHNNGGRIPLRLSNWSFALMVHACWGPSKLPFAWLTLACVRAVRNVSRLIPYDASACGLA